MTAQSVALYRCEKCGAFARPLRDDATDAEYPLPPTGDCKCFKGPTWQRGVWTPDQHFAKQGEKE